MRVVGLMSGTSYDGIDVAVADLGFSDADPDEIEFAPLGAVELPHAEQVRELIAAVLPPAEVSIETVCRLDTLLGQAFAEAAAYGIERFCGEHGADLVVSHGQTVFHWIDGGRARGTLQLGQPAWIAERTGLPVVSDLRSRDIARGGQGAPLVSRFDQLLLPPADAPRAALNIGGIANMTVIRPDGSLLAYDLGPGNALLDLATREFFDEPYDVDGRRAAAGTVHPKLLAALGDDPYFEREAPKSTGKELFHAGYLADRLAAIPEAERPKPADVLATLIEFTAQLVVAECRRYDVVEVIGSGGGVRNPLLVRRVIELGKRHMRFRTIDEFGVPSDAKEAYAFALLGFLTVHGIAGTVPECTGAGAATVLGTITPGMQPVRLGAHDGVRTPTRVRIVPERWRIGL